LRAWRRPVRSATLKRVTDNDRCQTRPKLRGLKRLRLRLLRKLPQRLCVAGKSEKLPKIGAELPQLIFLGRMPGEPFFVSQSTGQAVPALPVQAPIVHLPHFFRLGPRHPPYPLAPRKRKHFHKIIQDHA
jgi:hypothetical protein